MGYFAFMISFYNFQSFCELACCLCESQDLFSSAIRCIKGCIVTLAYLFIFRRAAFVFARVVEIIHIKMQALKLDSVEM